MPSTMFLFSSSTAKQTIATKANKPDLARTYLQIKGGTFGYVFGGGNNATVTNSTVICINNASEVTKPTHIPQLTNEFISGIGLNASQTNLEGD